MPQSPAAESFAVGWRQIAVCFLLLAAAGMIAPTYSLVAVPLGQEFKPSRMVLMLAMTVLSGACAILSPLLGSLMDRFPLRRLMLAGGAALALGYAAISFATEFWQVLVIFGVLIAPANVLMGPVAITVLLSRWFAAKRGRAIGIAISGIAAGSFVFSLIIGQLFQAFEWRTALQVLGLILFLWTVPIIFLIVDRPSDRGLYPDGAAEPPAQARAELEKGTVTVWSLISDPAFWMIVCTVSIVTAGMKGMITNLGSLAVDVGIKASDAAFLISIYSGCSFVAKLSFAALADKLGPRPLMFIALGGFAAGMACLTQAWSGYGTIALGVALVGMLGGFMVPIESYLAPRVFGQKAVGKAMGLLSGTILVAMLASPPLFGLIFDLTGSYTGVFWAFSGLALAALLWVPAVRVTAREDKAPEPLAVPAE